MSTIESEIDDLYQRPLGEFVAARNAIAKRLRGDDARRLRQLAKPTAVAWAINQLFWRQRAVYDRVRRNGERLRTVQIAALEGKPADVRGATESHRKTVADAAQAARRLATEAGQSVSTDALVRTLDALSVLPDPAEAPGRLTQTLQSSGFGALAGVTPRVVPVETARRARGTSSVTETPPIAPRRQKSDRMKKAALDRERRETAALLKRAEASVNRTRARVAAAERHEAHTREMWERMKRRLEVARAELARATEAATAAQQRAGALSLRRRS